jgi:hypothetical protein
MAHRIAFILLLAMALGVPAMPVHGQSLDDDLTIMRPEPGSAEARRLKQLKENPAAEQVNPPKAANAPAKGRKRIGSSNPVYPAPLPPPLHYVPPPVQTVTPLPHVVPPSMYVPQTGMVVPNLPTVGGAGPGGSETSQDRAMRCAHQSGLYPPAQTGDRNAYIGSCVNQ